MEITAGEKSCLPRENNVARFPVRDFERKRFSFAYFPFSIPASPRLHSLCLSRAKRRFLSIPLISSRFAISRTTSTQLDVTRRANFITAAFFLSPFSFSFYFCHSGLVPPPASEFRRAIRFHSTEIRSSPLLFSIQHRDFSRLFSRRPFCPPSFATKEQSLNDDACQKKSRFPSPLSVTVSLLFPNFLLQISPSISPLIVAPPRPTIVPSSRVTRVTIQDTKEEIRRIWILSGAKEFWLKRRAARLFDDEDSGGRLGCEKRDKKGGAVLKRSNAYTSSRNSACLRTINCLLFFGVTRPRHEKQEARKVDRFGNSLYVAADRKESREIEFARTYDTQEREGRERSRGLGRGNKNEPRGGTVLERSKRPRSFARVYRLSSRSFATLRSPVAETMTRLLPIEESK